MNKLIFECEIITPMFLSGADNKTPELRPPSIKGALRFWWRAINSHLSLKDLKEKETKLFGGASDDAVKSSFSIRVKSKNRMLSIENVKPCPRPNGRPFSIPAFKPKQYFDIIIMSRDNIILELVKKLVVFVSIVGGFGKRSRRGFGSIKINKIINTNNEQNIVNYDINSILNLISDNNNYSVAGNKIVKNNFNVSIKYPFIKEIEIGSYQINENKLLEKTAISSHINDCDYTGFAKGKERFSSPIYVSIIKNNEIFYPIITTLSCEFKSNNNHGQDKSIEFKKNILRGENE